MIDDRFILLKSIVLINSPDQIEQEEWFAFGDLWQIASWIEGDTYYYLAIQLNKLHNLYYA
jgi:hypothetical protein